MASLQQLKTRLNSITTTKKITKAMQLVATSKLKKAQSNLESIQEYYTSIYDIFQELLANVSDVKMLTSINAKDVTLYIVITSDLGLAGSYNSLIYKLVDSDIKPSDKLIVIGTKGVSHYRVLNKKVHLELPNAGDNPNYDFASKIGSEAIAQFFSGEVKTIKIAHTKFINSVTFETILTSILPIEHTTKKEQKSKVMMEFEPSPEKVLMDAIPLYVSAMVFGSMVESKVSEMSSRRTAMENATENAEEIIAKLDLEYNRSRQAAITQEITEIVAGANAE